MDKKEQEQRQEGANGPRQKAQPLPEGREDLEAAWSGSQNGHTAIIQTSGAGAEASFRRRSSRKA